MPIKQRIKNLPSVGKPVVFKLSQQARNDIIDLLDMLRIVSGDREPLKVSEVIRSSLRIAAMHVAQQLEAANATNDER